MLNKPWILEKKTLTPFYGELRAGIFTVVRDNRSAGLQKVFLGCWNMWKKFQIGENLDFPYGFRKSPVSEFLMPKLIEMTYDQSVKSRRDSVTRQTFLRLLPNKNHGMCPYDRHSKSHGLRWPKSCFPIKREWVICKKMDHKTVHNAGIFCVTYFKLHIFFIFTRP